MLGPALGEEAAALRAGSILLFNLYASSQAQPEVENTRLTITNRSGATRAVVRLFFVPASGPVAQRVLCLVATQTRIVAAVDVNPGARGHVVAIAVDPTTGCPRTHNDLLGSARIKLATGHVADLPAVAFEAFFAGAFPGCTPGTTAIRVPLDGVGYSRAPRQLIADDVPSPADGNDTLLVLNPLGVDLQTGVASRGGAVGRVFDAAGGRYPFTAPAIQQVSPLGDAFPTTPAFPTLIASGVSGWLDVQTDSTVGLAGALLTYNPNGGSDAAAFTGGHNLRHRSLTDDAFYVMPVAAPVCP